ncbi:MAG: hypothetical protein AAB875_02990, partial [Patescibacteria group bacterium]
DLLINLPLRKEVVELIFAKVDSDIETAIRQQRHILSGTRHTEVKQAREVIAHTNALANRFITDRVDQDGLLKLAKLTGDFLEEKFEVVNPRDADKRKMQQMLLAAPLRDRLGRVNPTVSRLRARSAYLAASKRLIVASLVVQKFETNQAILVYERETSRWVLREAIKNLETFVLGTTTFRSGKADTPTQRSGISSVLSTISEDLATSIRVKPYLMPAKLSSERLVKSADFVLYRKYGDAEDEITASISDMEKVLQDYASIEKKQP